MHHQGIRICDFNDKSFAHHATSDGQQVDIKSDEVDHIAVHTSSDVRRVPWTGSYDAGHGPRADVNGGHGTVSGRKRAHRACDGVTSMGMRFIIGCLLLSLKSLIEHSTLSSGMYPAAHPGGISYFTAR